jgi:hypothetical protein
MAVSAGLTTTTRATCGPQNPLDLPPRPGHLERHSVRRRQALREQLERLRRRRDPTGRAQITVLDDSDLTEIAVHIQADRSPDRTHLALLHA